MYDIRKRRGFQTVGELRAMLNHLPVSFTRSRMAVSSALTARI